MKLLINVHKRLDQLSDMTGRLISWLTLVMVLVTCMVVVARYALDFGSIGMQESVMYMHGMVFMLGIAFTLKEKAHVRVDIFYERFTEQQKAWVDLLGTIFFLMPVAIFIGITSLDYVALAWSLGEVSSQPGGLPGVYLLKTLLPLMAATLALQGISEAIKNLLVLLGRHQGSNTDGENVNA